MTPDPVEGLSASSAVETRQSSGWDIRNAPRNYLWLMIYQVGSSAFAFGAVFLITRYLGGEGYGGIVAVIAASQVAQVLVNWTGIAVVRFGVDEFIETEKIARTFWLRLFILVLNGLLVFSLSGFWFPPLALWLKLPPETYWLVIAHFAITALWLHIQMSLQAAKMARAQGALQMVERFLILAGIFAAVLAHELKPVTALICYIAAPAAAALIGLFQIRRYIVSRFTVDGVFVRKIVMYSAPLVPMAFAGYLSGTYLDTIFVTNFLSQRDLGIYSVATQINGIALQLPTLANSILIPLFISLEKESQTHKTERFFENVLPTAVLVWGFLCSAAAFAAFYMIPLVFKPEFAASTYPLWILLAASSVGLPVFIGYSALSHARSATYMSMFSAIFSAATNVIFNIILIPRYGMAGCAWATLIAYFVSMATFAVLLRRTRAISFSWVFVAMVPPVAGAVCLSATGEPLWALLICTALAVLVAYWKRASFNETLRFVKNFS